MNFNGNGLIQGIQAGNMLVDAYYRGQQAKDQAEVKSTMAQGLQDAKASREQAITNDMNIGGKANMDNTMTVPTFANGDNTQQFSNETDTRKNAEKNAPSVEDFYMRDVVPKIKETLISQGNQQGADQWGTWADNKATQTGMRHWAKALQAGQRGDFNSFADNMVKAYNTEGYYDDGLHAEGYDLVKDKDGNTTGLTLKMKNKDTGETFAQTIHGQDDMIQAGIGLLQPENAFKTTMARQDRQQTIAAGMQKQQANNDFRLNLSDRQAQQRGQLQEQQNTNATNRMIQGKELDRQNKQAANGDKVTRGIKVLQDLGYDEAFIKDAVPQMMGVGQYKKAADPKETARLLYQTKMTNDFAFARKTPDEQAKEIQDTIKMLDAAGAGSNSSASPAASSSPLSGGLPKPAGQSGGGGMMIYDSKTQKMIPYGQ